MAETRVFIANHESYSTELRFSVDFEILTVERATEINAFWSDADSRLASCDEDARIAVVRLAAQHFLSAVFSGGNPYSINRDFHSSEGFGDYEHNGIRLLSFNDEPDFDFDYIEVNEVEDG